MVLWIVLGLVLVGGLVALVVSSSGGDDDDSNADSDGNSTSNTTTEPPSGPEEVVDAYLVAMQQGDCEAGIELVTEASWQEDEDITSREDAIAQCQQEHAEGGMDEFDGLGPENTQLISQTVFGANDAVAIVSITPVGAGADAEPLAEVPVVDQGDGWLIDWTQMSGSSSASAEATSPDDFEEGG